MIFLFKKHPNSKKIYFFPKIEIYSIEIKSFRLKMSDWVQPIDYLGHFEMNYSFDF
jgi:hypothetical protein